MTINAPNDAPGAPPFNPTPLLASPTLTLRPLQADDFEALYAVAADPLLWAQHPSPLRYQRAVFTAEIWQGALRDGALVISETDTGRVIGSSRYYDWDPVRREVAIGYTFLARPHWGGATNALVKQMMLTHAFGVARCVWFHVGSTNFRSRRALEKIGAVLDHETDRIVQGNVQPTAYYRIDAPAAPGATSG